MEGGTCAIIDSKDPRAVFGRVTCHWDDRETRTPDRGSDTPIGTTRLSCWEDPESTNDYAQ